MALPESLRPNTIYAVRNDRLGGRLGAILNALRIAEDYGAEFRFFWPAHDDVSPELQKPEELFSADFLTLREQSASFGTLLADALPVEQLQDSTDRQGFSDLLAKAPLRCSEALRPVALPWEEVQIAAPRVATMLDRISFVPEVRQAMQAIRKRLGDVPLIAYHLRRGDIIDPKMRASNTLWPSKYVPSALYEAHILKTLRKNPNAKLVVFSDSARERDFLTALSGHVIAANNLLDDLAAGQLQQDFLELYAMSLCGTIIAPAASNFSTIASILGNSRIIPVSGDLSVSEKSEALDHLTRRMRDQPDSFSGDADLGQNFPELIHHHRVIGTPHIAKEILAQHWSQGFSKPYICDLLAEEYFWSGDAPAAIDLAKSLSNRPILTDLANAPTHAWAGLAAFAAGNMPKAIQKAQVSSWLYPIMPLSRLLIGALNTSGNCQPDSLYPVDPVWLRELPVPHPLRNISERLSPTPNSVRIIPFEMDLRDWSAIQTVRLPASFTNAQTLMRIISSIRAGYSDLIGTPELSSFIGRLEIDIGLVEAGAKKLRQAFEQAPDAPLIAIRYARYLAAVNGHEAAVQHFARAAELSEGQVCFMAEYARALLSAGNRKEAFGLFQQIAARDHSLIEIHIQTADALRRRKPSRELALEIIEKACALAPGARRTEQLHQKILQQLDRQSEAAAIVERFSSWNRALGGLRSRL